MMGRYRLGPTQRLDDKKEANTWQHRRTCVIPVSSLQKSDSIGLHVGLTNVLNSSTTLSTLDLPSSVLSLHSNIHTGNSCNSQKGLMSWKGSCQWLVTYNDLVRVIKICAQITSALDVQNEKGVVWLLWPGIDWGNRYGYEWFLCP